MFFELIEKRRSIRQFKPVPVEKEKQNRLIEAALRAPSSRGFNPWKFIAVDDPELLEALSRAKQHGSSFLKNAPFAIVVLGDPAKSDVWVEDTSIASIFIHLAAEALGLGSCWIQIRKREHCPGITSEDYVRNLLNIPASLHVASIIAIGHPDQTKPGHPAESLQTENVFINRFG